MADRLEKTTFTIEGITNNATIFRKTNKKGTVNPIWQLDSRFNNLQGKLRRYEASTKLEDKKLALKILSMMKNQKFKKISGDFVPQIYLRGMDKDKLKIAIDFSVI